MTMVKIYKFDHITFFFALTAQKEKKEKKEERKKEKACKNFIFDSLKIYFFSLLK